MRVSVLVAATGEPTMLARTHASLRAQRGSSWELVVARPNATAGPLAIARARGVRVVDVPDDAGMAAAYESARASADGDVLALLAPGETLSATAFARVAGLFHRSPDVEVAYADEDRVSANGVRHDEFLRPEWSPDYMLSALYVDHAFFVRRNAVDRIGGFRREYDPVPEWDLLLRLADDGRPFAHLSDVVFHRRGEPGQAWRLSDATLVEAGRRAVADACRRRGTAADVVPLGVPGTYRVRHLPRSAGRASVIVPFRDGAVLLERCVRSVLRHRGDVPVEIVLVDNGSVEEDTRTLLRDLVREPEIRILPVAAPFNFSMLVNRGAAAATGDVLCLLNSDVEALAPGWLDALLEQALRPDVGAVGARLIYPDGSLQHGGIALGIDGMSDHVQRFAPRGDPGRFATLSVVREVSAVTGACLATRREVFARLGGFDPAWPSAHNDVDYCLRVQQAGLRVLYTPHAELLHHEGGSRGRPDPRDETLAALRRRWGARLDHDPYWRTHVPDDRMAPSMARWVHLQARRLRWLARDVRDGARGAWQTLATLVALGRDQPGIARLEGTSFVVPGELNRYRLRLVNPSRCASEALVTLRGSLDSRPGSARVQRTHQVTLAPVSASDVACETNWVDGFELVEDDRPLCSHPPRSHAGAAVLTATVSLGRRRLVARIRQRSST